MTFRAALVVPLLFSALLSVSSHAAPLSTFIKPGPDLTIGNTVIEATLIQLQDFCPVCIHPELSEIDLNVSVSGSDLVFLFTGVGGGPLEFFSPVGGGSVVYQTTFTVQDPDVSLFNSITSDLGTTSGFAQVSLFDFPSMCTGADIIGTVCLLTGQLAVTLSPAQAFSIDSYEFRISGSFVGPGGPGGTVPEPSPLTLMLAAGLLAAGAARRATKEEVI